MLAASEIKSRRTAFDEVGMALIEMVRGHGIDQLGDLYVVHCPMAFGNKGADWLSKVPTVLNPYYGDAMLTCGSVKDTLSVSSNDAELQALVECEDSNYRLRLLWAGLNGQTDKPAPKLDYEGRADAAARC